MQTSESSTHVVFAYVRFIAQSNDDREGPRRVEVAASLRLLCSLSDG